MTKTQRSKLPAWPAGRKSQNHNPKLKTIAKRYLSFEFCALSFELKKGITLLLVIVLLSAIFSISIGIFNVVLGELKLSGEIADSFTAFYAADQGIEKILYRDRIQRTICGGGGTNCYTEGPTDVQSSGCYTLRVSKVANATEVVISGQYRCGTNPQRVVKRGFQVSY